MSFRSVLFVAMLTVSACSGSPSAPLPPPPTPPPVIVAPPPITPSPAKKGPWEDWPVTPGDWVYRQDARGSIALFGLPGKDAIATLRCDRAAGRLILSLAGRYDSSEVGMMVIRTSSTMRNMAAANTGGTLSYVAIEFKPNDPLLDAMAFSRGRFLLAGGNALISPHGPDHVIPPWPELSRVIEDCR